MSDHDEYLQDLRELHDERAERAEIEYNRDDRRLRDEREARAAELLSVLVDIARTVGGL